MAALRARSLSGSRVFAVEDFVPLPFSPWNLLIREKLTPDGSLCCRLELFVLCAEPLFLSKTNSFLLHRRVRPTAQDCALLPQVSKTTKNKATRHTVKEKPPTHKSQLFGQQKYTRTFVQQKIDNRPKKVPRK